MSARCAHVGTPMIFLVSAHAREAESRPFPSHRPGRLQKLLALTALLGENQSWLPRTGADVPPRRRRVDGGFPRRGQGLRTHHLAGHNVLTRYMHSMSGAGALPAAFGRIHPAHGSPYVASLAQTALPALLTVIFLAFGLDPVLQIFTRFGGVASFSILLPARRHLSVVIVHRKPPRPRRRPCHSAPGSTSRGLRGSRTAPARGISAASLTRWFITSPGRARPRRDRPGIAAGRSCRARLATPSRRRRSPW